MKRNLLLIIATVLILSFPNVIFGQAPTLGATSGFALFTAVGAFGNDGATYITGDIGTNVGAFTGFPPGTEIGQIHVADSVSVKAATDVGVAYGYLSTLGGSVLGVSLVNGQILTSGVYSTGAASTLNGNLILNGQGNPNALFIIRIGGDFATGTHSTVTLINQASLCNVYWQIGGQFTLGDSSVFRGTIVANGAITLLEGSSLFGRGLSSGGAIALHNNKVNIVTQPIATITAGGSTTLCSGNSVILTTTTTNGTGPFSYLWSPGGQTDSFIKASPTVTTKYKVAVTSTSGCSVGIDSIVVTVNSSTTVSAFSTIDTSECLRGNNFVFSNTSTGASSYLWKFGDGSVSTISAPTHSYNANGTYSTKLIAISTSGCKDSLTKNLYVRPQPVTAFSTIDTSECLRGNNFVFSNTSTGAASYLWEFGDNNTSTNSTPTHSYVAIGTYSAKLIAISTSGCKDSLTKNLYVRPQPVTAFSTIDTSECLRGNNFVFSNTSTGASSYLWEFGDGSVSTISAPTHSYNAAGTFSAKLIALSTSGCKDSLTKNLYVRTQPVTAFSTIDTSECLRGNNFVFSNTSTGASSYLWKFGDNTTSTNTAPTHTYTTIGTFSAKLITISNYSCKDSLTKNLYVRPHPVAAYTTTDTSECFRGNTFHFTNLISLSSGTFSNLWKYGDGTTSNGTQPTHSYSSSGTYLITLIATSNYGCKDSISKTVYVRPQPVSSFTMTDTSQCFRGNTFHFTNLISLSSGTFSNLWRYGDGTTSNGTQPTHSYSSSGTYLITLIATSNYGCKDSISKTVYVRPQPVSLFTMTDTSQCFRGNTFHFTNLISLSSGTYTNLWRYGDGTTSNGTQPTHSYSSSGTYLITLIATSNYGCKDSISKTVYVRPQPITVFSTIDTSECLRGNNFVFSNTSTGATSYLWKFGDITTSTNSAPNHTYSTTGTFSAKLISISNFSCKDSLTKNLYVRPQPITVFSTIDTSECLRGNNFVFSNTSTGATSYLWKFGDNNTSTNTAPNHSYAAIGTFSAKLITISNYSCKDSLSKNLYVRPQPVTAFSTIDTSECLRGNNFVFNNTSTGASSYLWKFGDNNTSTNSAPTHSYAAIGTFSAKLITISNYSCKDSLSKNLYVRPQPVTAFSTIDTSECLRGNNFVFSNTSTGATSYLWKLGDNTTSTNSAPNHTYSAIGTFLAKLITITNYSCKDSIVKNLYVRPQPVTAFSTIDTSECLRGNNFVFSNTSTGASSYLWKFGDINTSTNSTPTHSYAAIGIFSAKLITISNYSCKDSLSKNLYVRPQPITAFKTIDTSECLRGNNFVFSNTSTGASSYLWKFGDNNTSTNSAPTHSYAAIGTFSAKLITITNFGCKDSLSKNLYVRPQPVTAFSTIDTSECLRGNNFIFSNTSTGASTYLWKFGDNNTSTKSATTHSYAAIGTFLAKLITITNFSCKDSLTKNLYVRPQPVTAFSTIDTSECLRGNNFVFSNTSTGASSYLWKFGDNNTSTKSATTHSYAAIGTFSAKLITITNFGCKDSLSKNLYVRPQPVTAFSTIDTSECLRGNNFVFSNTSTGASSYLWKFGDNNTSTNSASTHSYAASGTFSAKLITITNFGCKDSLSKNLYVRPQPVTAFSTIDTSECLRGNNFVLSNTSTISSGTFSNFWKFGDNTTSTAFSPTHAYPAIGTYIAKLIITTNFGCKDSLTKNLILRIQPVTAYSTIDTSLCLRGNKFVFINNSNIGSGTYTFKWKFGDNTTSSVSPLFHTYPTIGTYIAWLVTTSNYGCKDSISKNLYVRPHPITTFNSVDTSECFKGNYFVFINHSTVASPGTFTNFWKFGDNITSTNSAPSHSYTSVNNFQVKLITTSNYGCKDSLTKNRYVRPLPITSFTINDTDQCLKGNNFVFTNTTSSDSCICCFTSFWIFGDNSTNSLNSPSHNYATDGKYYVKLFTKSYFGCSDSLTKSLVVYPQPKAVFSISDSSQCLKSNHFIFTNTSNIKYGSISYIWYFGDAGSSTVTSSTHIYKSSNTYPVTLVVNSSNGCSDQMTKDVYVKPQPAVDLGKNITMHDNQSLILDAGVGFDSYLWSNNDTTSNITVDTNGIGLGKKLLWVKVSKDGCYGTDSVYITFIHFVSIDNKTDEFDIAVYPNPTYDVLNIAMNGLQNDVTLILNDMHGKFIRSVKISAGMNHIPQTMDLSELAKGVYFLNIQENDASRTVKIVKY